MPVLCSPVVETLSGDSIPSAKEGGRGCVMQDSTASRLSAVPFAIVSREQLAKDGFRIKVHARSIAVGERDRFASRDGVLRQNTAVVRHTDGIVSRSRKQE